MLGLMIEHLSIGVNTNKGEFSCSIPFKPGLNIIRAENSSGKSTCVNAIAYALGLEAILGPNRKRHFPKSLYDEILDNKEDQKSALVQGSTISIIVCNSKKERVKITRDVLGDDKKVSIVSEDGANEDYFLGSSVHVGSAVSEKGFHNWLAKYLGWNLPDVITYDGKQSILYLECIFPLFFIEQKRGWSEIQANTPTHYGIKNIKRSAIEFCLNIDNFEYEKKVDAFKKEIEKAELEWQKITAEAKVTAEFNSLFLPDIPEIERYAGRSSIEFLYLEGETEVNIFEKEISLVRQLAELDSLSSKKTPNSEDLEAKKYAIRALERQMDDEARKFELSTLSISENEKKLKRLNFDLDQYYQLQRLQRVGSDSGLDLETTKCPICEAELFDTLSTGSVSRSPMSLDENIDFLKSQVDFFSRVNDKSIKQADLSQHKLSIFRKRLSSEFHDLEILKSDLSDVDGELRSLMRDKIFVEIGIGEVNKLKVILESLRERAQKAYTLWNENCERLKSIRASTSSDHRQVAANQLQTILRANLKDFKFNPSAITSIAISKQTFRPEQEGYDIVAETSASDYIRIIWAYTLGLMELAAKEDKVKHGGFVVFDEPRQHEASKLSFSGLIDKACESANYGGQVIFATSLDEKELVSACEGKKVNVKCFSDYILVKKAII